MPKKQNNQLKCNRNNREGKLGGKINGKLSSKISGRKFQIHCFIFSDTMGQNVYLTG